MKTLFRTIVLTLIFAATACNDVVKLNQIPGIYKANFPTKGIYIYIFKDGTCKFQDSSNQKIDIKTATCKVKRQEINIQMTDTGGIWPAEIEDINGKIRIIYSDENGSYFNKIQNF